MEDIVIHGQVVIPANEFTFLFARSGGPGGQNVNKVNSKATLQWDLNSTTALHPATLQRLRVLAASRISEDGVLQITSQVHRDQLGNINACKDRLRNLILEAMHPPKPRKPTRPTLGSKKRRLEGKRIQSQKKQGRSSNSNWD